MFFVSIRGNVHYLWNDPRILMFSLKTSMLKNINVFQTSPDTNFPQLSYILITSCIQKFRDYVHFTLLYGLRLTLLKPAIHYLRTGCKGNETILLSKQGECAAIYCSLFAVNFCTNIFVTESTNEFLFSTKNSFVFVEETATSTQILRTACGKKLVCKTQRISTIHYSLYILILSFHPCFVVVRE